MIIELRSEDLRVYRKNLDSAGFMGSDFLEGMRQRESSSENYLNNEIRLIVQQNNERYEF